jgi:DNA-binding NtrC family response regulator
MNTMNNTDPRGNVLIVDDEPNAVKVLSAILGNEGYAVHESHDVTCAIDLLRHQEVDAVITDIKMPGNDGLYLYDFITEQYPQIPVIFLTAYGTIDSAVHAMLDGAFYYFIKPPDYDKLKSILSRAVEQCHLKKELAYLRKRLPTEGNRQEICGVGPEMRRIFQTIEAIKDSESSTLICGETGTGKELIAKTLHYSSIRSAKPFIAINCAAIPRELMESELFGYERGAFTGALSRRIGRFEEAAGGTIFLDEIGEMDLSLQAKLLRVLEEREVERIGSNKKINVDFRLLSSTNRDLRKDVRIGQFREDLYYRINVVQIKVPPLRERRDDIPLLISEFIKEFCTRENKAVDVSDEVMKALMHYDWPGNIRQLRNVIERAVVLAKKSSISLRDLPDEFSRRRRQQKSTEKTGNLKEFEMQHIMNVLKECLGNKSKAAKTLGISRKALYKRFKEFPIL